MVGPTVHLPLIDVLLYFRLHRISLIADVSKMYRAIELDGADRDLHRFVWRSKPDDLLQDYRMTRVTFGIRHRLSLRTWQLDRIPWTLPKTSHWLLEQ